MSFFKAGNNISTRELAEKCEKQEAQLKKIQVIFSKIFFCYRQKLIKVNENLTLKTGYKTFKLFNPKN